MAKVFVQAEKLGWKVLGRNLGRGGQGGRVAGVRLRTPVPCGRKVNRGPKTDPSHPAVVFGLGSTEVSLVVSSSNVDIWVPDTFSLPGSFSKCKHHYDNILHDSFEIHRQSKILSQRLYENASQEITRGYTV